MWVSGAWLNRGLEIQRGAAADTETLRPAGSNPFWTRQSTNMGPYVWERTRALLCYFKLAIKTKTFCQAFLPLAIGSVIKLSCEDRWKILKKKRKKKKNTHVFSSHNLSLKQSTKANTIKQTYVFLIPLLSALINHILIWVLNLYSSPIAEK